jgi:tRNA(Ile)-lysidine synthase
LLRYGKSELREFIRAAGVPAATDETNENLSLRRNAIRALLRDLERLVPGANRAMARSAKLLGDDKALLESLAAAAWRRALVDEQATALATQTLRTLPPALLRRTIRHAVKRSLGTLKDFHFEHCDSIAQAIAQGSGGTFHAGTGRVELSAGRMTVLPEYVVPERSSGVAVEFTRPSAIVVPAANKIARDATGRIELRHAAKPSRDSDVTALDADALPPGTKLTVRTPREGDRCRPGGRRHAVSLARFLAKSGVPRHQRRHVLVLCRNNEIVAVLGVRVMEPYVAHGKHALLCQFRGTS